MSEYFCHLVSNTEFFVWELFNFFSLAGVFERNLVFMGTDMMAFECLRTLSMTIFVHSCLRTNTGPCALTAVFPFHSWVPSISRWPLIIYPSKELECTLLSAKFRDHFLRLAVQPHLTKCWDTAPFLVGSQHGQKQVGREPVILSAQCRSGPGPGELG